ncbi:hypothetical protein ACFQBU_04945 [Jhaorihella thermophila]
MAGRNGTPVAFRCAFYCPVQDGAEAGQILTASAVQLRRPVHSLSVGRHWRQHPQMPAPFMKWLDPAPWPEIA